MRTPRARRNNPSFDVFNMDRLSVETLKRCLHYEPATGVFTRLATANFNPRAKAGEVAGGRDTRGYVVIRIGRQKYMAHRLAWFYMHGEWPRGDVDHINRVIDDNRIANLREATRSQNNANTGVPKHNSSGIKGVCFDKATGSWMAYMQVKGKFKNLGRHATKELAAAARAAAFASAFGQFAGGQKAGHTL